MSLTRRDRHNVWIVTFLYCVLFLLFFGPRLNSDGANYYEFLASIVRDGDLNFADERAFYTPRYIPLFPGYDLNSNQTGYPSNLFTIGPALFWLPGQLLITALLRLAGADVCLSDYSLPSLLVPALLSCLAVLAGLLIIYRMVRSLFDEMTSLVVILFLMLTTHLAAFAFVTPFFAHGPAFFFSALFLLSWLTLYQEDHSTGFPWGVFLTLGCCLGMLTAIRLQGVGFAVIPLCHWLVLMLNPERRNQGISRGGWTVGYACAAVTAFIFMVPQLVSQLTLFGNLLADPQGAGGMHWTSLNAGLVLFHKTRGLFVVTPVLLPACCGLVVLWKRDKTLGIILIIALLVQSYFNMVRRDWCGVGFGMRRFIEVLPLLSFGCACLLAPLIRRARTSRATGLCLVLILMGLTIWNFLLMAQYYYGQYGHPDQTMRMTFKELAIGQVTMAPRMLLSFFDSNYPFLAVVRLVSAGEFTGSLVTGMITVLSLLGLVVVCLLATRFVVRSRIVTVSVLLAALFVLCIAFSLVLVKNAGTMVKAVPLAMVDQSSNGLTPREFITLSLHSRTPYRGGLDSLVFSSSGTFQRTFFWSYRRVPFLSHGQLSNEMRFCVGPDQPLIVRLPHPHRIELITFVIRFSDDGLQSSSDPATVTHLECQLVDDSGQVHRITVAADEVEKGHPVAIPENWRLPKYPENESAFFLKEDRRPPVSHSCTRPVVREAGVITELRLIRHGPQMIVLNGLAISGQ